MTAPTTENIAKLGKFILNYNVAVDTGSAEFDVGILDAPRCDIAGGFLRFRVVETEEMVALAWLQSRIAERDTWIAADEAFRKDPKNTDEPSAPAPWKLLFHDAEYKVVGEHIIRRPLVTSAKLVDVLPAPIDNITRADEARKEWGEARAVAWEVSVEFLTRD